jgi:hypothetical protein
VLARALVNIRVSPRVKGNGVSVRSVPIRQSRWLAKQGLQPIAPDGVESVVFTEGVQLCSKRPDLRQRRRSWRRSGVRSFRSHDSQENANKREQTNYLNPRKATLACGSSSDLNGSFHRTFISQPANTLEARSSG